MSRPARAVAPGLPRPPRARGGGGRPRAGATGRPALASRPPLRDSVPDRPLLVTSALPYANGPLHLGHLAGAYLPADLFVRYQRLAGRDVVWVCGSDEHGAAIEIRARREGVTPQSIVDRYHAELEAAFEGFGIAFDVLRADVLGHAPRDEPGSVPQSIEAADGFVRKTTTQLYDPEAGLFLADRFVQGTCPVCGYADAYGDQCENCGSTLSPDDLVEPRSTLSGATPEPRETTHWYLPLGDLAARARGLDRHASGLEAQRARAGAELVPGRARRPLDDARPRLGRPRPARGRRRHRRQGALRLVRRAHRLPLGDQGVGRAAGRRRPLAPLLAGPPRRDRARAGPLYRQGQHRLPLPDVPGHPDDGERGPTRPAAVRAADPGAGQRVPEPGGAQALHQPRVGRLGGRGARRLRRRPVALRAGRGPARDQGRRLHVVGLPEPRQRRAGRRGRQLRQPRADVRRPVHRGRGPGPRRAHPGGPGHAGGARLPRRPPSARRTSRTGCARPWR